MKKPSPYSCPACSHGKSKCYAGRGAPKHGGDCLRECLACAAVYTAGGVHIYLGESYGIVSPHFTTDPSADSRARYFDFMVLGSSGEDRRHGWFDPETGLMTQVG